MQSSLVASDPAVPGGPVIAFLMAIVLVSQLRIGSDRIEDLLLSDLHRH